MANRIQKGRRNFKKHLQGLDVIIEHVGSTSIPGLSAKPIIDIAIGAKNKEDLFKVAKRLEDAGYDMLNSYEEKGEVLAKKGSPECRTHYIHIQLLGSQYWNEFIYFKRYMLDHPESVKELLLGDNKGNADSGGLLNKLEKITEDSLATTTGYFDAKSKSFSKQIEDIKNSMSREQMKIDSYRARLEKQFSSMELIISSMQSSYSQLSI